MRAVARIGGDISWWRSEAVGRDFNLGGCPPLRSSEFWGRRDGGIGEKWRAAASGRSIGASARHEGIYSVP